MRPYLKYLSGKIRKVSPAREKSSATTINILYFGSIAGNIVAMRIININVSGLNNKS